MSRFLDHLNVTIKFRFLNSYFFRNLNSVNSRGFRTCICVSSEESDVLACERHIEWIADYQKQRRRNREDDAKTVRCVTRPSQWHVVSLLNMLNGLWCFYGFNYMSVFSLSLLFSNIDK